MRRSSAIGTSLLATALVGAVAFLAIRNSQGGDAAGLVVTPSRIDWGRVPLGEHREMTITIENRGRRQVLLGNPTPNCSCIFVISQPTSLLAPGKKTSFRIGLDPSKTDPRPFHKKIMIVSNDEMAPSIEIPVDGEVLLYRRWSALTHDFHAVDPAMGALPQVFQLRDGEGFAARAEDAVSTDPRFSVEVVPGAGGGSDIVVKVVAVAVAALKKGPVRAQITVKVVVTGHGLPPITLLDELTVAADLR